MFRNEWTLLRLRLVILLLTTAICMFLLVAGCKSLDVPAEEVSEEPIAEEVSEEAAAGEEVPAEEEMETEVIEEAAEDEKVEEETVPSGITDLITQADGYYDDGEYSMARKNYRDAFIAIDESDLSEDKKDELKGIIDANYQEALAIIDTAMMHFGNAKMLDYEKRFEEAKAELEAALAIYPKYQEAIDALASLEALEGLN